MSPAPARTRRRRVPRRASQRRAPQRPRTSENGNGSRNASGNGGSLRLLQAAATSVGSLVTGQVQKRIPKADLDARDPDYIRENLPFLWLLSSFYFRGEVRGIDNIPAEGPVLLVGNHSGGNWTPDTFVFTLAFVTHFGVERRFYQLAHNLVLAFPGMGMLPKYGTVAANPENARLALETGSALLVYPGGDWEVHRPTWQQAKVDFAGRMGWIELALSTNVPVVPVVSIGGQETGFFITRGEWIAKLLRLDKMLRLKVFPIHIGPPIGITFGDFIGRLPLPAKITTQVMQPIDLRKEFGPRASKSRIYDGVTAMMQETLDRLAAERRLPLLG